MGTSELELSRLKAKLPSPTPPGGLLVFKDGYMMLVQENK